LSAIPESNPVQGLAFDPFSLSSKSVDFKNNDSGLFYNVEGTRRTVQNWRERQTKNFLAGSPNSRQNSNFANLNITLRQNQQYVWHRLPWRRGIVVVASAYRTEDPGFESRQGVRF
jgi:hypothetical protein